MYKRLARLSKADLVAVGDLSYQAASVTDGAAVAALLTAIQWLVPVKGILCAIARIDRQNGIFEVQQLFSEGYCAKWLALYRTARLDLVDPVLRAHCPHGERQLWAQAYQAATDPAEKDFIALASDFGLTAGMTIGRPTGRVGCCSIMSFAGEAVAVPRDQTILEFLAPVLHNLLLRLAPADKPAASPLTAREHETLRWVALGKTTWETARILGISERTVVFHMHNVMRKLKVRNRLQAVAQAVARGLIDSYP